MRMTAEAQPEVERLTCSGLKGRVAVVTGAGSSPEGIGIGQAIAVRLTASGARICIVDRDSTRAEATHAMVSALGGEACVAVADVTCKDDCRAAVDVAVKKFGGVDILINNVGISGPRGPIGDLDEEQWERVFATNLRGALYMSLYAVPRMVEQHAGAVVNVASVAGLRASGGLAYGPSKAALIALTRELAVLHGPDGVRANAIAPGHLHTPMVSNLGQREMRRAIAPLRVEGTAWDVAAAAAFLSGDQARFVTGICLAVDGGVTAIGALAAHQQMLTQAQGS
jgi:NAD(P)-dependent dehydrogenase (short-subunit alcohol dehydrogenase family)